MIITVEIHRCPKCNSANITKNGHDYKDAQKFHCKACRAYGTLKPERAYPDTQKELILRAYRERASMHGIKRIFGVARQTLARWLKTIAEALPDLGATLSSPQPNDVLELDELWSFVLKKSNKCWVWIALGRRTRQIVAFYIGSRDEASCRQLWQRIPDVYKHCATYSDFWDAYQKVFVSGNHQSVGKESGQTAHVELALSEKLSPFPNQKPFIIWCSSGLFTTTIFSVSVNL
jgi:insertion element IS1 protein InsB